MQVIIKFWGLYYFKTIAFICNYNLVHFVTTCLIFSCFLTATMELYQSIAKQYQVIQEEIKEHEQAMKERDQAMNERDQAMKERDQARNERDQAMKERVQAMKEWDQTIHERDRTMKERDRAMKERDQAMYESNEAMNGRDQAMKEQDQAMKERDQTMNERDRAINKRDQLMKQRDQAMKQRDQIVNESDRPKKERDRAMKERDQAMKERDEAMKDQDQAMNERDRATKERDRATNERDQAMKERDEAMKDQDEAMNEIDRVTKERDQIMKEQDQVMKERYQAIVEQDEVKKISIQKVMEIEKEREQSIKERDLAVKECHQTIKERDDTIRELNEKLSKCSTFWIVPRRHVTVLEEVIGGGAWGYVKEGRFRDQQVAVKCVHEQILNKQTMQRVYREICTMSQVNHSNLVLFIAAVLDDQGGPMIITELLDTTLRKAYEDSLFKPGLDQCMDIFCDVASALCYLHELEEPIIHRDVSSANVLLKAMARGEWKAKLSDFGSANWAKEACTMGDGAIVYTAPEAFPVHPSLGVKPPPQTTKIDVYSYGILLCEVTLREFPDPATLHELKAKVKAKHASLYSLVLRCTETKPEKRPTMSVVLAHLPTQHNWIV